MQHAVMLSDQIDFLGGVPTVDVEKREISPDSVQMLKQDLKGEENAIKRYKERIGQAEELKEYGLRRVLEDILIRRRAQARHRQRARQ
jgi:bacterioferritin